MENLQMENKKLTIHAVKKRIKARIPFTTLVGIIVVSLFLFAYFISVAYPLFWMFISSFKETSEIYSNSWALPSEWLYLNYAKAWEMGVAKYFLNSVIVTGLSVIITVLVSAFAAYGLSRFQFKGKKLIFVLLSGGIMISPQVSLIPLYELIQVLGIHNTHLALVLPYCAFRLSLTILLIRAFFLTIPKELEESAYLDGCSSLGIFFRIFVPLSKPILLTTVIVNAFWTWNELLFAVIFIDSNESKTITAGLLAFRDALYTDWGVLMAGLVISAIPIICLFIALQKYFVRGLADGGVKG